MRLPSSTRILIVAHRTADRPELIDAVARRAAAGWCTFTLLVPAAPDGPHRAVDPQGDGLDEAEARLEAALPLLSAAAGEPVLGVVGAHDPLAAVQDTLNLLGFDEVIISMLPLRTSRWLRLQLPRAVRALGVPVTQVICAVPRLDTSAA